MNIYILLIFLWLVFFAVHSIMASSFVKNKVNSLHPLFKSYYRLLFNLIATLQLIPIAYIYTKTPGEYIIMPSTAYEIVGTLLSFLGTYILFVGFKNYRTDEFIGTYQIRNHHEFHPTSLNRSGWNGIVRHPLYFGGILILLGLFLISPTIKLGITGLLAIGYLYIGSIWEEKKLVAEFGVVYQQYQQEVSMLIPLKWLSRKAC